MRPIVFLFRSLVSPRFRFPLALKADAAAPRRSFHPIPTLPIVSDPTEDLLPLYSHLSKNLNNPKILSSVDVFLRQSHLLDSTASVLLLRGLAQANKLVRAKTLLCSLKQRGQIPIFFLYSIVLQCLLPRNPIRDVECLWNEVFAESSGAVTERFVFYVCLRCDDVLDIEPLCRRLLSSRWVLSSSAFTALIGAMCLKKNPNPGLSREVLKEMVERVLEVDDLSYYTLFRSFCRTGDLSGADSILRIMVEMRVCELDLLIYEDFLYCLCKAGKFREARKLYEKMLRSDKWNSSKLTTNAKPGKRIIFQLRPSNMITQTMTFEAFFRSLCRHGKLEEAESLLKEATRKHLLLGSCVEEPFLKALFSAGRHEEAIGIFKAARKKSHASAGDLAAIVIAGLCSIARVGDAYKLACEMANEGYVLTVSVWNLIMKRYWEDGRAERGMDIFQGIKLGTFCAFLKPDGSTYTVMIHGLLRMGMVDKAISVFEEMRREKLAASVDLYSVLVRNLHQCGRSKEARVHLNYMIDNGVFVSYAQWEVLFESLAIINDGDTFSGANQEDDDSNCLFLCHNVNPRSVS